MAEANVKIETSLLDGLITGRVEPHIYAFSTETIPNYLKVGDTARGVRVRLEEWKKIFPDLVKQYEHSARIDEETMFRDFAVHFFLEHEKGRIRLRPGTFDNLPYYSNEFFEAATRADLDEAMDDIQSSARKKNGKYQFYSPDRRLPQTFIYERKDSYAPRGNQQQVIDDFKAAVDAGRENLLMYAVMRFGKTFTSMCCAEEMDAKIVAIVTAKADVREEWKKTVESHVRFAGYEFLGSESLRASGTVVADTLVSGKNAVLFLTLQDLQGNKMKSKHKELFEHEIDLLIIDETHFGARGESYGKVLQEQNLKKSQIKRELKRLDGFETLDQVEETVKLLKAKIRLHLSGTPYRILMSDEFQKEDIVAFVQFTDIVDAQKQWDEQHLEEDGCEEWDNPYYGFPQMLRFAFNPNESSRRKMEELRREGITYALSELFRPCSMAPDAGNSHRQFKHEAEILDLLEVIDGTKEDKNVLGFLDYDKIKEGKMCRHIVCVLPFRASCDAMAELIRRNKARFKNLGGYEVVNIAGFDDERIYKNTNDVKRAIEECEARDKKTLTLTVNRMLTGTTVPQWDTMIYFKGTASPQEYDQAIFRLQNQYITTFKDNSGKTIRYNMKPQTLLVDFDPNRMFRLQELKSQFYNVNTDVQGNTRLKERIEKELSVSPIIVMNKDKLQLVTPANITDAVREYSRDRNILDEASEISTDYALLQDESIRKVIQGIAPIDAKNGLQINPAKGSGDDIASPDGAVPGGNGAGQGGNAETPGAQPEDAGEDGKMEKRLAAYYARILFFAFLTESIVKSLEEVIGQIPVTEDNKRIAGHFGLDTGLLDLILRKSNPFILRKLDYKIENVNDLAKDSSLKPIERVKVAMRKFVRLSESEIVTPEKIAREMVSILPFDELDKKEDAKFLDIASKQGEFAIALYERFGEKVKDRLYAIPTSGSAYEFTRKVYSLLGMPVENIFADFTSYDLIGDKKDEIIKKLKYMNFDVTISNPPYQIVNKGAGNGADPLYHLFIDVAMRIGEKSTLIHPARFLFNAGKTPKDWNNSILNNPKFKVMKYWANSKDVFPVVVDIKGGIAITYHDKKADFGSIGFFLAYEELSTILSKVKEKRETAISCIVGPRELYRITDRLYQEHPEMEGRQSVGHKYSLGANIFEVFPELFSDTCIEDENEMAEIYGRVDSKRCFKWIKRSYITQPDNFEKYKVIIPKANGSGAIGEVQSTPIVGMPIVGMPIVGYTDTFIGVGVFDTEAEAKACLKYIKTKFARAMLGTLKITQDNTRETWTNVPLQDFTANSDIDWSQSIADIDRQLYAKYGLTADEIAFIESMIKPME